MSSAAAAPTRKPLSLNAGSSAFRPRWERGASPFECNVEDTHGIIMSYLTTPERLRLCATSLTLQRMSERFVCCCDAHSRPMVAADPLPPRELIIGPVVSVHMRNAHTVRLDQPVVHSVRCELQCEDRLCRYCRVAFLCSDCYTVAAAYGECCESRSHCETGSARWVCPPCLEEHPEAATVHCDAVSLRLCEECHGRAHDDMAEYMRHVTSSSRSRNRGRRRRRHGRRRRDDDDLEDLLLLGGIEELLAVITLSAEQTDWR